MTAFFFGKAAKCARSCQSILKSKFDGPSSTLPALVFGQEKDDIAVDKYLSTMHANGCDVVVKKCGLFGNLSYLAALPDRLATDIKETPQFGLVEIKCPKSMSDKSILEACTTKTFCCEMNHDRVMLKRKHEYHYQVQGQLFVTGRQWCDFVMYTEVDIHIERVCLIKISGTRHLKSCSILSSFA